MTTNDLVALFDYHYWARDRVLDAADALTPEPHSDLPTGGDSTQRP